MRHLCLVSVIQYDASDTHPGCCVVSVVLSFSLLNTVLLVTYAAICVSIFLFRDTWAYWAVFSFCLL